jgi:hypothetical protein
MCHLIVKDLQTNIGDRPDSLVFERERREKRKEKRERGREGGRKEEHLASVRFAGFSTLPATVTTA